MDGDTNTTRILHEAALRPVSLADKYDLETPYVFVSGTQALVRLCLLQAEIEAGQIDVESEARTIIIRIREKGSFASGSAQLDIAFLAVLDKTGLALNEIKGSIFIEGHTDNVPIDNGRYGSNWDLAAARAVAVAEHLLEGPRMDPIRLTISGHADTRPQAPNDSWEGRAQNRRVEVIVKQPLDESQSALIREMRETNPETVKALGETDLNANNFEGR